MKPLHSDPIQGDTPFLSLASASQPHGPLTTDQAIEAIGHRALTLAQTNRCAIFLRQRDGLYSCPWSIGLSPGYIQKILAEAVRSPSKDYFFAARPGPVHISDTRKVLSTSALSALSREEGYRAIHLWPVESRGTIIAAIGCYYNKPHSPSKGEYKAMSNFLYQASSALESAIPPAEHRPAAVLNGLYDLSRQLVVSDSLEILLERFVQSAVEIVQATFCRVLTQERDGSFVCRAAYPARFPGGTLGLPEPMATQTVYQRIIRAEAPFLLRHTDVTLSFDARHGLELDYAHTLCLVPLRVDSELVGILVMGEERSNEVFHIEKVRLASMVADLVASVIQRERLYRRLEDSYLETILALTRTLEARDPYTAGHSNKMVDLVEKTGKRLGCSSTRIQSMRWAALLHDIGKIGVPDEILRRAGPLSDEEWVIMKKHPQIGEEIIKPINSLAHVGPFILSHHEHFDGGGYPYGLKGEEIPLEARIISVVDAYCAMTDGRVYRAPRTHSEAVAELKRCSGKHFDPLVVEVFLNVAEKDPV